MNENTTTSTGMNAHQLRALSSVLDTMLSIEAKHWEESGRPSPHMYLDLLTLAQYEKSRMLELAKTN